MSKGSFVQGTFILTFAGFCSRFIGAFFRIILASIIGDEGIGLFQMAYPIYSTLLAISTAGIPIAISKMVSERLTYGDYRGAYRVFRLSFALLTFSGLLLSLTLYKGAAFFANHILEQPRAYYPLLAISPAIFLVTVMSSLRGFFQGQQLMTPTALSQICEQLGRVIFAIILVVILLPRGLEFAAAGATFGAAAGAFFGLLVLIYLYLRHRGKFHIAMRRQSGYQPESSLRLLQQIVLFSVPITLGSLVMPLVNLADMVVVVRLQDIGFSPEKASALYGQLTGMANSLIHFPTVVTMALSVSLVPAISEAFALHNRRLIVGRTDLAMRLTMYVGLPSAAGLLILARPITIFLFDNAGASYPLAVLSVGVIFLSLYFTTAGILQGMGKTILPTKNMFYGVAVKFALTWFLTGIPALNIGGAAAATVCGFFVASFLNIREMGMLTGWRMDVVNAIIKPLLAVIIMVVAVLAFSQGSILFAAGYLSERALNALVTIIAVVGGAAVYGIALLLSGAISEEDLATIPRLGRLLAAILDKFNLLRR
ncbi:MAG: putative polysaccharide biosynthesis protein [Dethiobacteria bacterium]